MVIVVNGYRGAHLGVAHSLFPPFIGHGQSQARPNFGGQGCFAPTGLQGEVECVCEQPYRWLTGASVSPKFKSRR